MMMKLLLFSVAALCAKASEVVTLTYENFEEQTKAVAGDGGVWFVEFYSDDCGHCTTLQPLWEEIATELKGEVHIAKVDANNDINRPLNHRFAVSHLPALFLIKDGDVYMTKGPPPSKKWLLHFARGGYEQNPPSRNGPVPAVVLPEDVPEDPVYPPEHTGHSDVVILTDDNFEHLTQAASGSTTGDWLIDFHAPWCGHCRFLEPIFEQLATEMKDDIVVGKVDVIANKLVAQRFNINSYPTVKFFRKGEMRTFQYKGTRAKEDFLEFMREEFTDNEATEIIPKDFTSFEIIQIWLNKHKFFAMKRLDLAKKDVAKGKYWSPHTVVVLAVFLAILVFALVLFSLFSPVKRKASSGHKPAQNKKSD